MALTLRQVYEGTLVELNKVQAPSMLLEDFNYFANKAINLYINKKYNVYDVNQQSTDDLRVLKSTTVLDVKKTSKYGNNISGDVTASNSLYGATYESFLPDDYLHLLNCVCNYKVKKRFKCYEPNTYVQFGATRLTADLWGLIINNFYMKPSYKKPYYYLHNVNTSVNVPTNVYNSTTNLDGTDMNINPYNVTPASDPTQHLLYDGYIETSDTTPDPTKTYYVLDGNTHTWTAYTDLTAYATTQSDYKEKFKLVRVLTGEPYNSNINYYSFSNDDIYTENTSITDPTSFESAVLSGLVFKIFTSTANSNFPRTFNLGGNTVSLVERPTAQRLANTSKVRLEVRTGKDDSIFELESVYIDYIKAPQYLRLTQEQIDLTEDTSQMMEFPDYVCQEIINELTHLIMENSSDTIRLLTNMGISNSIASPAQQSSNTQQ